MLPFYKVNNAYYNNQKKEFYTKDKDGNDIVAHNKPPEMRKMLAEDYPETLQRIKSPLFDHPIITTNLSYDFDLSIKKFRSYWVDDFSICNSVISKR